MTFQVMKLTRVINRSASGMNTSQVPMSFENRFRIRPVEVTSKNVIGAYIIALNRPEWSCSILRMQAILYVIVVMMGTKPIGTISPAYMKM